MDIYQVSVFVENKEGKLADITEVLAKNNINIRALSIADTTNFGILRLIVDDPHRAEKAFRENGYTVSLTKVIGVEVPDVPGGISVAMRVLSDSGISIEYMYAFISHVDGKACVIMRVEDNAKASAVLLSNGIDTLKDDSLYM